MKKRFMALLLCFVLLSCTVSVYAAADGCAHRWVHVEEIVSRTANTDNATHTTTYLVGNRCSNCWVWGAKTTEARIEPHSYSSYVDLGHEGVLTHRYLMICPCGYECERLIVCEGTVGGAGHSHP